MPSASPFLINVSWDASVSYAPSDFTSAVLSAAAYLESQFTDPVTVNLAVGYGEIKGTPMGGALGESQAFVTRVSYGSLRSALASDATSADDRSVLASLPASAPVSGTFWVTTAQAKALGLASPNGTSLDGYLGFSSSYPFTYANNGGVASGSYDFMGIALHEMTEILGRMLFTGTTIGGYANGYTLLDLLHFSGAGARDFSSSTPGYFSTDGGGTDLGNFNTAPGGDAGDWSGSAGADSFNAFVGSGARQPLTANDLRAMDAIGWNVAAGAGVTTTLGSGSNQLVLKISQDAYLGDAQYTVSVDGAQIGGTLTARAAHGSGQDDVITVLGNWATGAHKLTVTFLNDAYGGSAAADRNLYVDGITFDGAAVPGGIGPLLYAGPKDFGFSKATNYTVGTGSDTLVLKISEDAYLGDAQYSISIDGAQLGTVLTGSALHGSGQEDTVTVLGDWSAGAHRVTVTFLNDAYAGSPSTDRNLYVDALTFDGTAVPGGSAALMSGGPKDFGFNKPANLTLGTGSDTLVLKVSEDAYLGDARYTVSVDGTQVGGVLTAAALHGSGQDDTVAVLGNWAAGLHRVSVNFLNDAYGGSPGADRNLYLDGMTLNGVAVPGGSAALFWSGPMDFGFDKGASPTIGSGSNALVLKISEDAYLGDAQYTVGVDGTQVGGVLTAAALHGFGQDDTVTVLGNWARGPHQVAVNFLNDAYAGAPTADRNLYVDGISYNGAAVPDGTAALFSNGPRSFSFS